MKEKILWVVQKVPVIASFFIGVVYSILVLANYNKDTTAVINAALAISAGLAGLCFGMSATVDLNNKYKKRINYAGERFFHAVIFFLLATILKYAALSIISIESLKEHDVVISLLTSPLHILVIPMFMYAIFNAHSGVKIMNDILWSRLHDVKDWDDIV